jgi:hypothetical protein
VDGVLQGLDGVFCYLDDILLASTSSEEHCAHLRAAAVWISAEYIQKCQFWASNVHFLGHMVDADGVKTLDDKVWRCGTFSTTPQSRSCRHSWGMLDFYGHFCSSIAQTLTLLIDALESDGKGATCQYTGRLIGRQHSSQQRQHCAL